MSRKTYYLLKWKYCNLICEKAKIDMEKVDSNSSLPKLIF